MRHAIKHNLRILGDKRLYLYDQIRKIKMLLSDIELEEARLTVLLEHPIKRPFNLTIT